MYRFGKSMRASSSLRSNDPISDAQIKAVAPSIFADAAHDSRGERYTYIPTCEVLARLRREGFEPFAVAQTSVRDETKREFTKHMLRLRHRAEIAADEANEVILLNSHDGTSSYQMVAGMIRFACANGLISGDLVQDVRVRHSGKVVDQVLDGAHVILEGFDLVREVRAEMKSIQLEQREQVLLAQQALQLRYEPAEGKGMPITERQALMSRRMADDGPSLWNTYNRLQENLTRGGLPARTTNGRRARTRAVTGIDQDLKLNRALFSLADGMRKLKNGELVIEGEAA